MDSYSSLKQKFDDLRAGKLTCYKNVSHFLSEIDKNNEKYNIFLEIDRNSLEIARNLDDKYKKGDKLGALFGLVFAIKSNISKKGMLISCGSDTLSKYKGTFDADVVKKIQDEDGIIIGIVNNDEFASGSSGETSFYGKTHNPAALGRIPGGSSSGSAAAVAAGMCDIALGSDTGGSIRNPASHCGIVGVKPSYGRVSRYGLVDLSMSLDQIGPFSRDIFGCALVLSVIAGKSENDPTTEDIKVFDYTSKVSSKKYKVGVVGQFDELIADNRIRYLFNEKVANLVSKGHEIVNISIKNIDLAIQAYYPIVYTEFYSGTRKFDGVKYGGKIEELAGDEVLRRIYGGMEISKSEFDGAYYKKALKVKEVIAKEFERAFNEVDFIICPVTPMLPHKFGVELTPEQMYSYDAFTIPANLGGICGGVVSMGKIKDEGDKVPVGIQVFAGKFKEDLMFRGMNLLANMDKKK